MTENQAQFISACLNEVGYESSTRTYSGRGMYGDSTHAVVTSASLGQILAEVMVACSYLNHDEAVEAELLDLQEEIRIDSMGLGVVLY